MPVGTVNIIVSCASRPDNEYPGYPETLTQQYCRNRGTIFCCLRPKSRRILRIDICFPSVHARRRLTKDHFAVSVARTVVVLIVVSLMFEGVGVFVLNLQPCTAAAHRPPDIFPSDDEVGDSQEVSPLLDIVCRRSCVLTPLTKNSVTRHQTMIERNVRDIRSMVPNSAKLTARCPQQGVGIYRHMKVWGLLIGLEGSTLGYRLCVLRLFSCELTLPEHVILAM